MFTLNPALHFIKAAEQDVVALYRSTSAVTADPPGGKLQSYEAVVFAVGKEKEADVYVTLLDSPAKRMLIYVPEHDSDAPGPYAETLKEALRFAESLGFSMERVNLNYSKALREVIIRNIRVFQPLPDLKKSSAAKRVERQVAGEKTVAKKGEAAWLVEDNVAAKIGDRELEKLEQGELKRLLAEKTVAEERAAEQARETMLAWEKAEKERTEREFLIAETAAVRKRAEEHAEEARLARGKADADRFAREKILAEKADAEKRAAEQAEAARLALERAEAERAELERVLAEKAEAEKRAAEREEAARRALEKAEAERAEREKVLAERAEAEKREAEQAETARVALAKAEAERAERQRLLAEKAAAEQRAEEHAEAARRAKEQAEAERAERERLRAEKSAAERFAAEQAEAARRARERAETERERLLAEKTATEQREAKNLTKMLRSLEKAEAEQGESELLLAEKISAERSAVEKSGVALRLLEDARDERAEAEGALAEKAEAERQAEEALLVARLAWETAEATRVEHEQLLVDKIEAEDLADKQAESLRAALQLAERERSEQEQILSAKKSAVLQAAEAVEMARRAQKQAETERIESERLLAEAMTKEIEPVGRRDEPEPFKELVENMNEPPGEVPEPEQPSGERRMSIDIPEPVERLRLPPVEKKETVPAGELLDAGPAAEKVAPVKKPLGETPRARLLPVEPTVPAAGSEPFGAQSGGYLSGHKEASPFFNPFAGGDTEVTFAVNESLECIDIDHAKGIRDLYCSTNMARVTMGAFPAQNCAAFLGCIEKEDGFLVYVAFFLSESNRVLVYTPDRQPEDLAECDAITGEGMRFIETVGFIMDRVETGGGADREKLMKAIPALGRVLCGR